MGDDLVTGGAGAMYSIIGVGATCSNTGTRVAQQTPGTSTTSSTIEGAWMSTIWSSIC